MVTVRKKKTTTHQVDRNARELTGTVEGIVYQNKLNDYTVLDLATDEGELITAVGQMPYVGEGERVKLLGTGPRTRSARAISRRRGMTTPA